ncbi:hypothetical protein FGO68_gene7202 [Halteria grandinella]|uniref:RING-type domain-containing protein n=1 Tax=Halteria grandinella TaxID=5974 RepID=A0A8J8T775_HALGN|nr:hypothetical protein FGO68_gene7202 [Halteria grandinella]
MNTSSIEDQLLCSVCLELFYQPVTTNCGHTFCKQCLIDSKPSAPFAARLFQLPHIIFRSIQPFNQSQSRDTLSNTESVPKQCKFYSIQRGSRVIL